MKASNDRPSFPHHASNDKSFNLADLVLIIGYKLTAYIGGATSTQSVVDWLRNGLPPELESRMRAVFDVAKPIAEVESELVAQGFLIGKWEELGSYGTPAQMLREADVQTARTVLTRMAIAEFLSNEVPNLEEVTGRLQEWISRAELPEGVGYTCHVWHDRTIFDACSRWLHRRSATQVGRRNRLAMLESNHCRGAGDGNRSAEHRSHDWMSVQVFAIPTLAKDDGGECERGGRERAQAKLLSTEDGKHDRFETHAEGGR